MYVSTTRCGGAGAVLLAAALLAGLGCGEGDDPAPSGEVASSGATASVEDSWMFRAVETPEILGPFEAQNAVGQAWLGLYHNDLKAALTPMEGACTPSPKPLADRAGDGYPCVGLARLHLEQAATYIGASEVDRIARRQFYLHRAERPEDVLASTHETYFSGLNLVLSGLPAEGNTLLTSYAASDNALPLLAALATRIAAADDPLVARIWGDAADDAPTSASLGDLPASADTSGYAIRLAIMESVARGEIDAALATLQSVPHANPDLQERLEQETDTGERVEVVLSHVDSAWLRSLGRLHALAAKRATGGAGDLALLDAEADLLLGRSVTLPETAPSLEDGIAFVVFSGWPTPSDRLEALRPNARPSVISRLGAAEPGLIGSGKSKVDDLDAFVRLSNSVKDRLTEAIRGAGGSNMDVGMGLSDRFLSRLMADGARDIQLDTDTRLDAKEGKDMATAGVAARSLLEMALDKNPAPPSRKLKQARISFRNDPPFLVDLALANLDTKRPYDANEYIRPLTEVYPELIPVRDGLAALDSAWNPMRAGAVR